MQPILLGVVKNAYLLVLIPVIVSIIKRSVATKNLALLLAYIYVCLATEALAKALWWMKINNLVLLHVFSLLEFLLLSLLYRQLFKNKILRLITFLLLASFLIFSSANSFFIQSVSGFNSYSRFAECLFIIFYSISYFVENYYPAITEKPSKKPFFWINSGIFIYFSGSFCLFVLSNYLLSESKSVNLYIWAYHTLLLGFYYILISVGIWKTRSR